MASSQRSGRLILLLLSFLLASASASAPAFAQIFDDSASLEWAGASASLYGADFANVGYEEGDDEGADIDEESGSERRSLYWRSPVVRYYISYGALSANRIPCPPRSGRSYYTHNCFKARGPVHPYSRGCSSITRCRR